MKFSRRSMLSALGLAVASAGPAKAAAKLTYNKDLRRLLEKAIQAGGAFDLPAGRHEISGLMITSPLRLSGVPGQTILVSRDGRPVLTIDGASNVSLHGVTFESADSPPTDDFALVTAAGATGLLIESCGFAESPGSGLRLEGCSGRVTGNRFSGIAKTALFARDSKGLEISGNSLTDIGNNGIQVWTSEPREDGTIVSNNRIAHVAARDGGTGQNGNGINIYKAGNVSVSANRVSDCAFSAIRNNGGSNCQIVNNAISRTGEVAIYCEFGFEGAVVSGNLLEDVALGISITNFNEGGRLAVVANNVIRKVTGGGSLPATNGVGIGAEADTVVTGNVIEDAADTGLSLGWGQYARNLSATGNLLRNCRRGIVFSAADGADRVLIANNRIAGSRDGAILGGDHGSVVTGDLGLDGAEIPGGSQIAGNLVS